jgi:hypothetical protein
MTDKEAQNIYKNSKEFMLGMYTERWCTLLRNFQKGQNQPFLYLRKETFEGEIPIKFFERHAWVYKRGIEVIDCPHTIILKVLPRPKLEKV